jgi:hypothetical protein
MYTYAELSICSNSGRGVESNWVHSARRSPIGLLYLLWVVMRMENLVEWWLAGETEALGENLPKCHFVHHKSHITWSGVKPGRAVESQRLGAWVFALPLKTLPCRNSNPDRSAVKPVASRYTIWAIPAPINLLLSLVRNFYTYDFFLVMCI